MFVKVTPRKKGDKTYYYAELVESYRENGKTKHKRILNFGSVDKETAQKLKIAFSKDFDSFTNIDKVDFSKSVPYGEFYLLNSLSNQIGMFQAFHKSFISTDRHITAHTAVEYIKGLVFQRISDPDSKLAFTEEYSHTSLPHFLNLKKEIDLQTLYRSLEVLEANFSMVENHLYEWALKQFNQNDRELFYDITSSYFEGRKCVIAEYGYSRDKRRDREQIVIGLVTTSDGFPIKCTIYSGNKTDKTTVSDVVTDLKKRYPIEEVVFVGDRGMLTSNNIESIKDLKQKYVMAIPRTWTKKYLKDISISESTMRKIKDDLYAKFLPEIDGQRFLLCLNTQKREDDKNYRLHCIEKIKSELEKLNQSLGENKNIKTRDEAMKRAGGISRRNKSGKYFAIETIDSDENPLGFSLKYELKLDKVKDDERLDGTFVIQTNEKEYEDEKLIKIYKNLNKVENAFRIIKHDLDVRPMYHWKEERVKGHVYVCVIAYFLMMAIEYIAKQHSYEKTARAILQQLHRIHLLDIDLPDGDKKYSITTIEKEIKDILKVYKIKKMEVPDVV
jgi:transposase